MGGIFAKRTCTTPATYRSILSQYEGRCEWLKDTNFLRDLEADSVDSEILDEELRSLELHEQRTCRRRTNKVLESSPLQIAMCVLVLFDAAIVVSEILLDLNAMRSQSDEAASNLALTTNYLHDRFSQELANFNTRSKDVTLLVQHLTTVDAQRRQLLQVQREVELSTTSGPEQGQRSRRSVRVFPPLTTAQRIVYCSRRSYDVTDWSNFPAHISSSSSRSTDAASTSVIVPQPVQTGLFSWQRRKRSLEPVLHDAREDDVTVADDGGSNHGNQYSEHVTKLLKAAHMLHYGSIAILGIFVIQVSLKVFAMGCEFFKQKLEIFDGVIVISSFVLDVVFLEGVTDARGEQAAALIMVFLLWRILRIINGLMITNKKRQEFRLKLQKRARIRLEKKVENLREDLELHQKETLNLKSLCATKGATEEEIVMCKPRRRTIVQMTTMTGLSSIASLSLGLSMSGTAAAMMKNQLAMFSAQQTPTTERHGPFDRIRRRSSVTPPAIYLPTATPSGAIAMPGGLRPMIRRQPAVCPSPVQEFPAGGDTTVEEDENAAEEEESQQREKSPLMAVGTDDGPPSGSVDRLDDGCMDVHGEVNV